MVMPSFDFLSTSGCLLCDELQGDSPLSTRIGLSANVKSNILLESELFVLIADISPLVQGHSLLIPKEHYPSFARLPNAYVEELRHFRRDCIAFISRQFCTPFLFEHGSGFLEPKSGACIHHAHLHVLPLAAPVEKWIREFGEVQQLGEIMPHELSERLTLKDYLAYQDQWGTSYLVAELESRPPCQFIRRRIAEHLNLDDWHWETTFIKKLPLRAYELQT